MDPRTNPYAPGAGTPPPELAGRDAIIEKTDVALYRLRNGLAARGLVLYGLRGVGKTVLLNHLRLNADAEQCTTVRMEVPEGKSLPGLLAPALRAALIRMDRLEAAKAKVRYALRVLAGFVKASKSTYPDIEIGLDVDPEKGVADSGDLNADFMDLIVAVGEAAIERKTAVVLFIDELQYVPEKQLAALILALHNASQSQLPVSMVAAGLPQLIGRMGKVKSYAERLFEFVAIDKLDEQAAIRALCVPAEKKNIVFEAEAIEEILRQTHCYPYFLQEWGKHCWDIATGSPITGKDAKRATEEALVELDASFFRVRLERLTPSEKRYMRALAELGPNAHRSGDVADRLKKKVTAVAPTRSALIAKGMMYSPAHGDTAFTVPLFDGYMKRIMPTL